VTDRHQEPYIAMDPAAETMRRQPADVLPTPYPGEGVWVRTAPLPAGSFYLGPSGRRDRGAWLALIALVIGGSALYLAYAAVVAPEMPAKPALVAQSSAPLTTEPPLQRLEAAPSVVVPPPLPRVLPPAAPTPAATPVLWTPAPVRSKPHRVHRHRLEKPVRVRVAEPRPAIHVHVPRETRHPLSWYAH
jgi:hypothetical protein